jgi:ATP-dependent DNA helicase PIF1
MRLVKRGIRSPNPIGELDNPFEEYAYVESVCPSGGPVIKRGFSKAAPKGVAEFYGIGDDDTIVEILSNLTTRCLLHLRRTSKQISRCVRLALCSVLRLVPEQVDAFLDAVCGRSIFITGPAGAGKSHLLQTIVAFLPSLTTMVTASTGIAAANIGAVTIHSGLCLGIATPPANVIANRIRCDNRDAWRTIKLLRTLVIDEVSMLDGRFFTKAGLVASDLRRGQLEGPSGSLSTLVPWYRIQLILVGDFLQLPAVESAAKGLIFESQGWEAVGPKVHHLCTSHRQSNDPTFFAVLGRARVGEATPDDLQYLVNNSAASPVEGALHLFACNAQADCVNRTRFGELTTRIHQFNAIDTLQGGAKATALDKLQIPNRLFLRVGCRVMCRKNVDDQLVNGSIGTVVEISETLDNQGRPVRASVRVLFDGMLNRLPHTKIFHSQSLDSKPLDYYVFSVRGPNDKLVGSRVQIPLTHAWAVSIHKSQGLSLDRVRIEFRGCFESGQAYVALSRCRALEGAHLNNLLLKHLNLVDKKALEFYKR